MFRSLTLEQLGSRIDLVDATLLALVANRMTLTLNVGALKKSTDDAIYNRTRERERLDMARYLAVNGLGLDDNFAHALLYLIIDESCKQQMIQLQNKQFVPVDTKTDPEWHQHLRSNLLRLTAAVAPVYDADYNRRHFALTAYREFEDAWIAAAIRDTRVRGLALDLGCGTGSQSFRLAESFENVIGYDVSPDMIRMAQKKLTAEQANASFEEWDLENGLPQLETESVSFVLMNLGTASDVIDLKRLIDEVSRVLKSGGRYLFSFYNAEALVYSWEFLPWPDGLTAEINAVKSCLDVRLGEETYSIYAKSYTKAEIELLLRPHLSVDTKFSSYPTVSAILPDVLFGPTATKARETIAELDQNLSTLNYGAYTIVTGQKA